ncbi:MAG: thioredoxin family protein [Longimicrobiales bacterium]
MASPFIAALLLAASAGPALPCVDGDAPPRAVLESPADDVLRALYMRGQTFDDFHAEADSRRELWDRNYGQGQVPEDMVRRARAVGGTWHLLAVAIDGCSDSVSTIPYLALLAERVPGLEMRIVDSTVGRAVMEARRTPDGRAATPTVVLLDADYDDAGCFIERPKDLQAWLAENDGTLSRDALFEGKMGWYQDDAGASTVAEVVALMEAAAAGQPRCDGA